MEPNIRQRSGALTALETIGMPAASHGLDHATFHEFATLPAAGSKHQIEIIFAVLSVLELKQIKSIINFNTQND